MVRLADLSPASREREESRACYEAPGVPWTEPPRLAESRVAIISTAGLQMRDDLPFVTQEAGFRALPGDLQPGDLLLSHHSTNWDRSGLQQDLNVAFPIDRARELVGSGAIGSLASTHYSFMGAVHDVERLVKETGPEVARRLLADRVQAVLLFPV